ncbi:fungal-specific transcription factor domain-containing protein [Ephemerocybe angulata]|uniref:Fungal-specific transcription factor domain-containing protein n=1 Tax=Ephemerocybe angulata TaxID=980116 RepID=A0A8H6HAI0_9AGAR|nr:fungal-specific transcription factor domain-containing protein [Tulosesus angulatus]
MSPVTPSESQDQQQPSSSSSILKERRFKLSRACDRCRRRRIKCDEGHPCQACMTANSSCTFEEPGKRTHPHKSKRTATLEDRMHHLETLISAIPPAVFAATGAMPGVPPGLAPSEHITSPMMPFMYPTGLPPGVPPPSLHVFPLTNPSTHFTQSPPEEPPYSAGRESFGTFLARPYIPQAITPDQLAEETSRMSLTASYLYFDDEGYTRWQGETSGLPVLDLLVESHSTTANDAKAHPDTTTHLEWFPNRQPQRTDVNPQTLWRLITSSIAPDLMDSLVQCYLSTSYYILPFLHVPTFLADYGNPQKWGEPGFAAFIVSICCLASRHMDDPRVRADPTDGISAGTQWFELLGRLRTLPIADRPTPYNIQENLIAAVYAVGLGKLSKAAALLAEAVTMCIDAGLHRSADNYDLFDPIEDEVRKRTFWCVYIWDKQLSAHFGRPAMLRLRDCDVAEPSPVDDEFITRDGVGTPPPGTTCRMAAFIVSLRIMVVLESVLDVPPARHSDDSNSFLLKATNVLSGVRKFNPMREEEILLDEIHRSIPLYWQHTPDTLSCDDTIRMTQSVRLHCAEQFARLLIYRHRFSELVAERTNGPSEDDQTEQEKEALISAHNAALQIVTSHLHIAKKGLMTYYGVHVIHQLTQAGRTLVAVLLCCKTDALQHLIPPGLDALRSCIGLLRRFSGRYVCGLRSGDLMEEFCRLTNIPLETNHQDNVPVNARRPPWIRPVRKKTSSIARSNHSGDSPQQSSPEPFSPSDFFSEPKVAPGFASGPPSNASGSSNTHSGYPPGGPHIPNGVGPGPSSSSSSFPMDHAVNGMAVDMIREDSAMYMSNSEMMAFFGNEGAVDMNHLFSTDAFLQQQQPRASAASPTSGAANAGQPQASSQGGTTPGYLKMAGLVTSP